MEIPARSQDISMSQVEATVRGKTCPSNTGHLPVYKKVIEICPDYHTRMGDMPYHDNCIKEFGRRNDLIRAYNHRMDECSKASGPETTTKSKFSDRLKDATKRAEGAEETNKRNGDALSSGYEAAVQEKLQADEAQEATAEEARRRLEESVRRHTAEVRKQLKNGNAEVQFDLTRCTHIVHGEGYVTCWLTHGWDGQASQCEPQRVINGIRYTYCRDDE